MLRTLTRTAILLVLLVPAIGRSADDEEDPKIGPKRLSEWLQMLRSDEKPEMRRKAALVLEFVEPVTNGVLVAVRTALKEDSEERVRAAAAVTLGRLGARARDPGEAIVPLVDALQNDKSEVVREAAAASLGGIVVGAHEVAPVHAPTVVPALRRPSRTSMRERGGSLSRSGAGTAWRRPSRTSKRERDRLPPRLSFALEPRPRRRCRN